MVRGDNFVPFSPRLPLPTAVYRLLSVDTTWVNSSGGGGVTVQQHLAATRRWRWTVVGRRAFLYLPLPTTGMVGVALVLPAAAPNARLYLQRASTSSI